MHEIVLAGPVDPALVAWEFECNDMWCVEFATSRGRAKSQAAGLMGCDFIEVRIRRTPWWDAYAALGYVPAAAVLAAGQWLNCSSCGANTTALDGAVVSQMDRVTCGECVEARS